MTRNKRLLLLLIGVGLVLNGCDLREGTIVYDVDFPQADSCESTGSCDSGGSNSGSGSGGAGSDGGSVTWDAVTSGEQQIELTWLAYSGASSYTIYWNTSGSVDNNSSSFSEISGTASTSCPGGAASCLSYIHGGLNSSAYYYYRIVANVSGKLTELSTEENASPLALSCTPSYTHDNDSDLLVYYDFNNNLEDQIDNYSDGRYDLTGGTIKFAQGCGDGLTGYFDSSSGYAENRNFRDNDSTVGSKLAAGNFTITMWVNADGDMPKFASALNTGFKDDMEPKGWQNKSQINIDGKGRIEWITVLDNGSERTIVSSVSPPSAAALPLHKWHHLAAVHYDNDTAEFYSLGKLLGSNTNFPVKWYGLVVGLNRSKNVESRLWKGYIDEVKVYGRALSEQEVVGACAAYTECKIPTNLSVTAGVEQNSLSWDAVSGATDYKIYWNTTGNVDSSSSSITVNGATTYDHLFLTGGTTYYYRVSSVVGGVESALSVQQSATPAEPAYSLTFNNDNTKGAAIRFSPDGTKFFVVINSGYNSNGIRQFELSTPWDLRTRIEFNNYAYDKFIKYEFNVAGGGSADSRWTNDFDFNQDGTKLFLLTDSGSADDARVREYNLATPYEISSVDSSSQQVHVIEGLNSTQSHIDRPISFDFNDDGTKITVGGWDGNNSNQRIYEFSLAGPYDFSSVTRLGAAFDQSFFDKFDTGGSDSPNTLIWKADGTKLLYLKGSTGEVYSYSVSVPFDLGSTLTAEGLKVTVGGLTCFSGFTLNVAQDRLFWVARGNCANGSSADMIVGSMPFQW